MRVLVHRVGEIVGGVGVGVLLVRPRADAGEDLVGKVALIAEFLAHVGVHRRRQGPEGGGEGGIEAGARSGCRAVAAGDPAVEPPADQAFVGEELLLEQARVDAEVVVEDELLGEPAEPGELPRYGAAAFGGE